eukprot:gene22319-30563_t
MPASAPMKSADNAANTSPRGKSNDAEAGDASIYTGKESPTIVVAKYKRTVWIKDQDVDGPSKFLLSVIDEHHGEAPADWPGYRDEGGGH